MRSMSHPLICPTTPAQRDILAAPRRQRPSWFALLAATALTAGLTACGGGSSSDTAKPQSTAIDATTAAAAGVQPASAAASGADAAAQPASAASEAVAAAAAQEAVASVKIAAATPTVTAAGTSKTQSSVGSTAAATNATAITAATTGQVLATATTTTTAAAAPAAAISAASTGTTPSTATTTTTTNVPCSYEAKTTFATNCSALMSAVMADGESVTFSNTRSGYAGSVTASCSAGKISWTNATCQSTTQSLTQMAMATTASTTSTAPPDLTKLKAFTAKPPFSVVTKSGTKRVLLGIYGSNDDVARTHDFVTPLVSSSTARTNLMTLQTTAVVNKVPTFTVISDISTPSAAKADITGRYGLDAQGNLRVAYLANDPPSADKLRTQVNSWPIPTRKTLTWDLSVRFAGLGAGETWPATKFTASPVLIWQLKSDPGFPPMGMLIDVDPENPTKALQLTFFQRLSNVAAYSRRWVVGGIDPNAFNDFIIQAVPDDRETVDGGIGTLKVWLNGKLLLSTTGRNLIPDLPDLNRWCFGLYLTAESVASPISRYSTWRRARMLTEGGL